MCRSGSNSRCFVNGVQVGTTYTTLTDFLAGGPLIVGSGYYDPPGRSFNGYIDEFGVYNRVLDESEVTSLYNLNTIQWKKYFY